MGNLISFIVSANNPAVDTDADFAEGLLDPRSPAHSRTPLARLTSSKKRLLNKLSAIVDPRSPTLAFRRTPLVHQDVDYADPRSPMAGRTPVRRLNFDLNDPREPDRVRTPLTELGGASCVAHRPRRLLASMSANDDDDDDDSVCSAATHEDDDTLVDQDFENELSMESFDDEIDDDDNFEEVDLDADEARRTTPRAQHEKTSMSGDWSSRLAIGTRASRYAMLSPKQQRAPRLSLCASAVRGAIERAVQSARAPRHSAALATPIAALLMRDDAEDCCKAMHGTPPSPFVALAAADVACRPFLVDERHASSCPSSPAA